MRKTTSSSPCWSKTHLVDIDGNKTQDRNKTENVDTRFDNEQHKQLGVGTDKKDDIHITMNIDGGCCVDSCAGPIPKNPSEVMQRKNVLPTKPITHSPPISSTCQLPIENQVQDTIDPIAAQYSNKQKMSMQQPQCVTFLEDPSDESTCVRVSVQNSSSRIQESTISSRCYGQRRISGSHEKHKEVKRNRLESSSTKHYCHHDFLPDTGERVSASSVAISGSKRSVAQRLGESLIDGGDGYNDGFGDWDPDRKKLRSLLYESSGPTQSRTNGGMGQVMVGSRCIQEVEAEAKRLPEKNDEHNQEIPEDGDDDTPSRLLVREDKRTKQKQEVGSCDEEDFPSQGGLIQEPSLSHQSHQSFLRENEHLKQFHLHPCKATSANLDTILPFYHDGINAQATSSTYLANLYPVSDVGSLLQESLVVDALLSGKHDTIVKLRQELELVRQSQAIVYRRLLRESLESHELLNLVNPGTSHLTDDMIAKLLNS